MVLEFSNLAKALAAGQRLALTLYVLGYLYMTCFELYDNPFLPNQGCPIWILLVWLNAYFLELCSQIHRNFFTPNRIYYTMLPTTEKTFFELVSFFFNLPSDWPNFYFQPFRTLCNPQNQTPLSAHWQCQILDLKVNPIELKAAWGSFLIRRDLFLPTILVWNHLGNYTCQINSPGNLA